MILIDHKDRRPIYEQLIERFQQLILCEAIKTNEPMPSVRNLAYGIVLESKHSPARLSRAGTYRIHIYYQG